MIAISILFYTHWKGSEISLLFRSSHRLFNSLTGYPVIRPAGYPAGYRISKKAGYPDGYPVQPYHLVNQSPTHSLIHSLIQSLTHSLTVLSLLWTGYDWECTRRWRKVDLSQIRIGFIAGVIVYIARLFCTLCTLQGCSVHCVHCKIILYIVRLLCTMYIVYIVQG